MVRRNTESQQLVADAEWSLRDFLYFPTTHHYTLLAMWTAAASLRDNEGNFMPYALGRPIFLSNGPGTGKSLATEILCRMVPAGERMTNPTSPGLSMALNYGQVPGFEEFDKKFGPRAQRNQDMMAMVLNGYERDMHTTVSRNDQPEPVNISGPMVLNGNKATLVMHSEDYAPFRDRGYIFFMEKPPANQYIVEYDPELHRGRLKDIQTRFKKWGGIHYRAILSIQQSELRMDPRIRNRAKQIWTPLFRVAHYIGQGWPERIAEAAKAFLFSEYDEGDIPAISPAEELLMACRAMYSDDEQFLSTRELLKRLMAMPGDAWWKSEWKNPRAASMALSSILGTMYGVEAERQYIGGEQIRGYDRDELEEEDETTETTTGEQDNQDNLVSVDAWDWDSLDD